MELPTNVFPSFSSIAFHVEGPPESGSSQGVWNIYAKISLVAPVGYIALMYIFRWDLGQPVLSNMSKTSILTFKGNLMSRKRESDW